MAITSTHIYLLYEYYIHRGREIVERKTYKKTERKEQRSEDNSVPTW